MNKIKEELLHAVGDVTKNKQRVIAQVENRIEQPDKKTIPKYIPLVFVTLLVVCVAMLSPKLIEQNTVQSSFPKIDEDLVELGVMRYLAYGWDEGDVERDVRSQYVEYILYQKYAADHDVKITKEDLEKAHAELLDTQLYEELEKDVITYFKKHDLTEEDYARFVHEYLVPKTALEQKLLQPFEEKYPHFTLHAHNFLLTDTVHEYLVQHYEQQYYGLLETEGVHSPLFGFTYDDAVVLEVTDEAILLVSEKNLYGTEEEGSNIRWTPRLDDWDFAVGETIKIAYNTGYSEDKEDKYKYITLVKSMERLENQSFRIEVDKKTLNYTYKTLPWITTTVEPNGKPTYVITDNLNTYKGYLSNDRTHVTWYYDGKEATITTMKAANIIMNLRW